MQAKNAQAVKFILVRAAIDQQNKIIHYIQSEHGVPERLRVGRVALHTSDHALGYVATS